VKRVCVVNSEQKNNTVRFTITKFNFE
jgi:hypothetical protein